MLYGFGVARGTPISRLRLTLENALRSPGGITIPQRILNLEAQGRRRYNDLENQMLQERQQATESTQPSGASAGAPGNPPTPSQGAQMGNPTIPTTQAFSAPATFHFHEGSSFIIQPTTADPIASTSNYVDFDFVKGTYVLSAPSLIARFDLPIDGLELIVRMDTRNRLFGAFKLHRIQGVVRSAAVIEPRNDGASAKVEWCGQDGIYCPTERIHPPRESMTGVLRFTRVNQTGEHRLEGSLEGVPGIGRLEFTGERSHEGHIIDDLWEDFSAMIVDDDQFPEDFFGY